MMPAMTSLSRLVAAAATAAVLSISALLAAPAATAAVGDDRAVVNGWYQDFLGRDAKTDPGSQYWVDRLAAQAPADVLWTITHSREFNGNEVAASYNDYLGRAPDRGASYWVDGTTAQSFPLEWVDQNLLASNEYFQRWGVRYAGNAGPVSIWYIDVLGRTASDGEKAYWARRVDQIGRLGALRELWYSDEAVRGRINDHYSALLSRDADFAGLSYWSPKEVESDINVAVLLASTPEYRSKQYS